MSRIFNDPAWQSTKDDGSLNSSGKIYFREPGAGSTTLKSAYSNIGLTTALTNPVILGDDGRPGQEIWLSGDYNIQITDSSDVQIERVNNYEPPNVKAQFDDWNALFTYAADDFARGSNGKYYQSLVSGNLNNDPTTSQAQWVESYFIDVWNTNKTYALDDIVKYEDSMYVSLVNNNQGNQPDTSTSNWKSFFEASNGTFTGTLAGVSGSVAGTVNYTKSSGIVSLHITSDITGTSNTTALSLTGLPTEIRPANNTSISCSNISDSGVLSYGRGLVSGSSISFSLAQDNGAGRIIDNTFAAVGTKGLLTGWSITYPVE